MAGVQLVKVYLAGGGSPAGVLEVVGLAGLVGCMRGCPLAEPKMFCLTALSAFGEV